MASGICIHLKMIIIGLYKCLHLISSSIFMVSSWFQSLISLEFILVKDGGYKSNFLFFFCWLPSYPNTIYQISHLSFPLLVRILHFSMHLCPLMDFLFYSVDLLSIPALVPIILAL